MVATTFAAAVSLLQGCGLQDEAHPKIVAPLAKQKPTRLVAHGHERVDNYYWLRDDTRNNPEVLDYLNAENRYTDQQMAHTARLQNQLYEEIANRLVANDQSVPVTLGQFDYYREFRQGGEYPIYVRRHRSEGNTETILDVNQLAQGRQYFAVGNWAVSHDETKLAYVTDDLSRRIFSLAIKNLESGELLSDRLEGLDSSIAWSADGQHVFYVRKDPETLLPYQVFRHKLGTSQDQDQLIFEEADHRFSTRVYLTRSKKFIVIASHSTDSSEIRVIPATRIAARPRLLLAREAGHEYRIRHVGNQFFVASNWQAENFRLFQVDENHIGSKDKWVEVIAHHPERLLVDFEVFQDYLVLHQQIAGLPELRIIDRHTNRETMVPFSEQAYATWLHSNPNPDSGKLRYGYSSLTTPESVFEYDMGSGEHQLLKQELVRGDFNQSRYATVRVQISARDGTLVPVSLVYHKQLFREGQSPLYITGYGAYGYSSDPEFSAKRLSLLDRGVVFAIVHVRGGEELGRSWYESGKMLSKRNTFWDFIDATEALIDLGFGHPDQVVAMGASAGGLLMGVVANEAPELYAGIVAHVPFVDALTTMLDESIPLTTGEFSEWGNPAERAYYDYILSYSPYDQIKQQSYPNMLVTTGLYDSQVQYFEPAKWVAKLRQHKTDDHKLLLQVDMSTGHSGASGRYERFRADALEYAFVLDTLGIAQ